MEKIQLSIEKEKETSRRCEDDVKKINDVVSNLSEALYNLHFLVNPETTAHEEPLTVVQFIIKDLEIILHQIPNIEEISKVSSMFVITLNIQRSYIIAQRKR